MELVFINGDYDCYIVPAKFRQGKYNVVVFKHGERVFVSPFCYDKETAKGIAKNPLNEWE